MAAGALWVIAGLAVTTFLVAAVAFWTLVEVRGTPPTDESPGLPDASAPSAPDPIDSGPREP